MNAGKRHTVKNAQLGGFIASFTLLVACFPRALDAQTVPVAPSDLVATVLSANLIELDWMQNAADADGFKIEGALAVSGPWAQIAQISLTTVTYRNPKLVRGATYFYRVRAYSSAGDSGYSNVASTPSLGAASVVGWGDSSNSQASPPANSTDAVMIAGGNSHSLALKRDGTVVGWGNNSSGQASPPAGLTNAVAIAAGSSHSLALKSDGTVVGWGNNGSGQATLLANLSGVVGIAAGANHSLALATLPPGDVNGTFTVTTGDSLLLSQVAAGLRATNSPVFSGASYANGDVNGDGLVNTNDAVLINQEAAGLRSYVVTKVLAGVRTNTVPTAVTIYGIGFPTNTVTGVTIGPPVNLTLSNVIAISAEQIKALVPAGGGLGTGMVIVTATPTNGFASFGRFINQ